MEYWNNPTIECVWPGDLDPIRDHVAQNDHRLLWNPTWRDFHRIKTNQTLEDICEWAMSWLSQNGIDDFLAETRNHYDIANLVKLNIWARDIQKQGIVKPWLVQDTGDDQVQLGTGDTRLKLLSLLPAIDSVSVFVSVRIERAECYPGLQEVGTLAEFACCCQADSGDQFLFKFTDNQAPYGIYWYEHSSRRTRSVTPDQQWCVQAFDRWYRSQISPRIDIAYFLADIKWEAMLDKSNN